MSEKIAPADRGAIDGEIVSWIRAFVAERGGEGKLIDSNDELFTAAGLDSLGVVSLIAGLETTFGIRFSAADLDDPRFSTIAGIAELIREARQRPVT